MMTNKELAQYLLQSLNMGLGALMQGESSYTNSFDTKIMSDGFLFILPYHCDTRTDNRYSD